MLITHAYWIFLIWLASGVLGVISLPVSRLIFRFSSDKGYAFSRIVGCFAVSYIAFLAATLKLMPLPIAALAAAVFLWLLINLCLLKRNPGKILPNLRTVITTEVIFLLAFSGFLFIKSFQPEIYQIERFMDFGFIQALRNSTFLPLEDIWFAGEGLNYYYFGHFVGFVVLSLTGIGTVPGFYLLGALIFALLAAAVFRLGRDFLFLFIEPEKIGWFGAAAAGLLSLFAVILAGTWYTIAWIFEKIVFYFEMNGDLFFFFSEPTRIIPGAITEMPIYSFLVADLHAHVWGMLSAVLVLAVLYSWWRDKESRLDWQNLYFWALAVILGISYMTSSFDALTLGVLSIVFLAAKYRKEAKKKVLTFYLLLAGFAYITALPWGIFLNMPIKGIGLVFQRSPVWPWLSFWGPAMAVFLLYILWKKYFFGKSKKPESGSGHIFPEIIMCTGIFFLVLIEVFYVKDILLEGKWFRANTVFKVTTQVWIWINVFMGPVFILFYNSLKRRPAKIVFVFLLLIYISIGAVYPVIAVWQFSFFERSLSGIDKGLDWWQQKYPDDYQAYLFLEDLRKGLPQKERMKKIVEAEGESYTDVSRFSVFLGWPTIVGWPVHQWTWRGSYEPVGKRREQVREIYTGTDPKRSQAILSAYDIDYIIVGQVERMRYAQEIQTAKLRELGEIIFEQGETLIIEYKK